MILHKVPLSGRVTGIVNCHVISFSEVFLTYSPENEKVNDWVDWVTNLFVNHMLSNSFFSSDLNKGLIRLSTDTSLKLISGAITTIGLLAYNWEWSGLNDFYLFTYLGEQGFSIFTSINIIQIYLLRISGMLFS